MQLQQKMTSNKILTLQLTEVTQPLSSVLNDEVFKDFWFQLFYVDLEKHEACHTEICIINLYEPCVPYIERA